MVGKSIIGRKILSCLNRFYISKKSWYSSGGSKSNVNDRQKQMMAKGLPKKRPIPGVENVILVCSGKGGVGKSTTAVNLATAMARLDPNLQIGLLDADVFGPTVPLMMNLKEEPLLNSEDKMIPPINYNVKCMSMGLLVGEGAPLAWRGLMVMSAVERLLWQVDWGQTDYLFIDTPPGTGDTLISLAQNLKLAGAVVVSSPQKASLEVVRRGASLLSKMEVPLVGLVLNMSSVICPKCHHRTTILDATTDRFVADLGLPILCDIPLEPQIADCGDKGTPVVVAHPKSIQAQNYMYLAESVLKFLRQEKQISPGS